MHIYGYNNPFNNLTQITGTMIPSGDFEGRAFDGVFNALKIEHKSVGGAVKRPLSEAARLVDILEEEDVIITSSLTNFSVDFITALQAVEEFNCRNVRVIAYKEDFDSGRRREQALLEALPMMQKFRRNAFETKRENRLAGIRKAAAEGKYKGRKSLSIEDFPEFGNLFNLYMLREIGKGQFAERLGVSRPTLDKLLDDFTKRKGER